MKENETDGYKSAFKATALFGGVQVFTILVKLVKSKIIALIMGATGFGVLSLYVTLSELLSYTTNLGLQSSAVRDYSVANASGDLTELSQKKTAIRRWIAVTSVMGAIITFLFAQNLSIWMFDSPNYKNGIRILSIVVFLMGVYNGQYAYLQGIRKIKDLAKANVIGAVASLLFSLPFYFILKEDGIIWSLVITAVITTIVSTYYCSRYPQKRIAQNYKQSFNIGINTVKLGIAMSLGTLSGTFVAFIIRSIVVRYGGIEDVGLYQAGCTINVSYLGLVFTAIAKDYFPRLSAMKDLEHMKKTANEQAEIAILLLAPMIIMMIVFLKPIIVVLFTEEFCVVLPMIELMLLGSLVKAGSWDLSYILLAKGNSKLFLFSELGVYIVIIPIYYFLYLKLGLLGLGYAYFLHQTISFLWVGLTAQYAYNIHYSKEFWKLFTVFLSVIALFIFLRPKLGLIGYALDVFVLVVILWYTYIEFSKRVNILDFFKRKSHGQK
jgi:O-antigen/teichoic acid export membrane protein